MRFDIRVERPLAASEDYFKALDAFSLGSVEFVPISYELENGGMSSPA
jgi:hypothetical protein